MEMRSTKKKVQAVWKRAIVHFSLCFLMGFFTGFAPTAKTTSFFSTTYKYNATTSTSTSTPDHNNIQPPPHRAVITTASPVPNPATLIIPEAKQGDQNTTTTSSSPRRLVIMVTPMIRGDEGFHHHHQMVLLRRLADTVRLVEPPLLWIVVEGASSTDDDEYRRKEVAEVLRKTGVMYRQLVVRDENLTEVNQKRNLALKHIEQHRLSGIVHFADLSNVYDLHFFHHLRNIEVFGTWPVALLSANRKKVIIEGPVCDSSQVIGWHLGKIKEEQQQRTREDESDHDDEKPDAVDIHISNFAFNSSILWDPERWGRPTSVQANSQNSLKFVKQVVFDDETKLKGIPEEECSQIMVWRLQLPLLQRQSAR